MASETKTLHNKDPAVEHYPSKQASQIQTAVASLAEMEKKLDELNGQVGDMKRKLVVFAETQADQAKAEIIEQANRETQAALESVRQAAQIEAEQIIATGTSDTESLRKRIAGKTSAAVEIIVKAVQSA
jgi:vacuolar-type H+-ATPase subunit H